MAEKTSIGIVGTGWVGSNVAISTLHNAAAQEVLLHDLNAALAEGEAMDLSHGSSFYASARVRSLALDEMLGTELEVDPRSVHAQVIGEHGDSEVCVWYRRVSFDLQDVALSLPTIVGSDGAGEVIAPELDDTERAALEHSAEVLQKAIGSVAPEQ